MNEEICPVCHDEFIHLPNGVCLRCYERIKSIYIHDRAYWVARDTYSLELFLKRKKEKIDPAVLERNIAFHLKDEAERWERITQNGLTAAFVMIEILDGVEPVDLEWHKRRIAFMEELISVIDIRYFKPATRPQVDAFVQAAVDFWNGRISRTEADTLYLDMKRLLGKKNTSDWDTHSVLLWMIQEEENFDWMWYQWFECIYDSMPDVLSDDIWIALFQKHFPQEISIWAKELTDG